MVMAEINGVFLHTVDNTLPASVSGSGVASDIDFAPVTSIDIVVLSGAISGSATFILTAVDDLVGKSDETITAASASSLVNGADEISLRDGDAAQPLSTLVLRQMSPRGQRI